MNKRTLLVLGSLLVAGTVIAVPVVLQAVNPSWINEPGALPGALIGGSALAIIVIKESFAVVKVAISSKHSQSSNGEGNGNGSGNGARVIADSEKILDIKNNTSAIRDSQLAIMERQQAHDETQKESIKLLRETSEILRSIRVDMSKNVDSTARIDNNVSIMNGRVDGIKTAVNIVSNKFDEMERKQAANRLSSSR